MGLRSEGVSWAGWAWRRLPAGLRRRALMAANDPFMVGVVGFLLDPDDRLLLLDHRFRTQSRWGLPGGFIQRGEAFPQALARELREEVGLRLSLAGAPQASADHGPVGGRKPEGEPGGGDQGEICCAPLSVEQNTQGGYLTICLGGRLSAGLQVSPRSVEIRGGGLFAIDDLPPMPTDHAEGLRRYWAALRPDTAEAAFQQAPPPSTASTKVYPLRPLFGSERACR